ncbi:MAG: hypothetical protein AB1779_02100 [Candidatus Thermoplasmatota archaeon]
MYNKIISLMLKEEYRLHLCFTSYVFFLSFPFLVGTGCFFLGALSPVVVHKINKYELFLGAQLTFLLYGMSVGAFAFLGMEAIERRFGPTNFLISSSPIHPITQKKIFLCFYIKDVIFYIGFTIFPLTLGLIFSIPLSKLFINSILILSIGLTVSFLIGISLSFFLSSLYLRNKIAFYLIILLIFILIFGWGLGYYSSPLLEYWVSEISSLTFFAIKGVVFIILSFLGLLLLGEKLEKTESYKEEYEKTNKFFSKYFRHADIISKDYIDIKRSKTHIKLIFSFLLPLLLISFASWFMKKSFDLPLGFNTAFYASVIGFFGILVYGWLNSMDSLETFKSLPLYVSDVVKARIRFFLILNSLIGTAFVIGMSILYNETKFLLLALLLMFSISVYTANAIAYLTALWTNIYLFDVVVLGKFGLIGLIPLFWMIVFSLLLKVNFYLSVLVLIISSSIFFIMSYVIYSHIEMKWKDVEFL